MSPEWVRQVRLWRRESPAIRRARRPYSGRGEILTSSDVKLLWCCWVAARLAVMRRTKRSRARTVQSAAIRLRVELRKPAPRKHVHALPFGDMPLSASSLSACGFLDKCASPMPRSTLGALEN